MSERRKAKAKRQRAQSGEPSWVKHMRYKALVKGYQISWHSHALPLVERRPIRQPSGTYTGEQPL
jgi:hypothetical protein